jgi:hypothetical protein
MIEVDNEKKTWLLVKQGKQVWNVQERLWFLILESSIMIPVFDIVVGGTAGVR